MKKSIVWLASYPKSGNTWVRIFLTNYLANADAPVAINQVNNLGLGDAARNMYRKVAGPDADLLDVQFTTRLRDRVFRAIVANNADVNFVKTHSTRGIVYNAHLIPAAYTRAAIYIVRNPLDAVTSYAKHFDQTIKVATEAFCSDINAFGPDDMSVSQYLGSWSDHVNSWTRSTDFPVCVLRYEDLLVDPIAGFERVLKTIGIPVQQERLERAVRFSSFKELSAQESASGFLEKPEHLDRFFGTGKSGEWRKKLPKKFARRIMEVNGETMKRFGYIT